MTTASQRAYHDFSLDGRPTHALLRKMYEFDSFPTDFKFKMGFAENRPTTDDFEQSMNIKVNPGAKDTYTPN